MATSTKKRPRGPVSGAGARGFGAVWGRAKKKGKRYLDRHPGASLLAMILFGLVSILCLIVGLLAENLLFVLASGVSSLGVVAANRMRKIADERQREKQYRSARPPKTTVHGPDAGPRRPTQPPPAAAGPAGVPKCTVTGVSIDDCDCNTKHVRTAEGSSYYQRPIGTPIGKPKKKPKGGGPL